MPSEPDSVPAHTTDRIREDVVTRLIQVRNRHTAFRIIRGLASLLTVSMIIGVCLLVIESVSYLSPAAKIGLLVTLSLGLVSSALWWIIRPLLRPPSLDAIVRDIERGHGGLHQHLTNILQLWTLRDLPDASRELIDAAVRQAGEKTESIDFNESVDTSHAFSGLRRLGVAVFVGQLIFQLIPGGSFAALDRLANPTQRYVRPQETSLTVAPGDTVLIVGDSLSLATEIAGVVPLDAALFTRDSEQSAWTSAKIPVRESRAVHTIANVRESFAYKWKAHDAESDPYHVLVKPRPVVLSLTTRYRYPAYTGMPERVDAEGGDILGLEGTEVTLQIRSSRMLDRAWLSFEEGTIIRGRVDTDSVEASFSIDRLTRFTIGLADTAGVTNTDPVSYRVIPLKDEPPVIVLLRPGRDTELGERMQVPIMLEATDDFGVARAEIVYRVNQEGEPAVRPISLDDAGKRDLTQTFAWDLSQDDLLPGDHVIYRLRAYDNNVGTGETPEYVVRFPSMHEIQEEARRAHEETVDQLEDVSDQNREIQERMKEVAREILKQEEVTWENQAEIREAVQQQENLREKIDRNIGALDQTRERLEQSGLLTPETLEKLQQVRSLMQTPQSSVLQQISQELKDATEDADPELIREALERMTAEQESFQQNLDRTIALLERVRNQQMLDALTVRLQDIAQDQEDIHQQIESDSRQLEETADHEAALQREAENLQKTLKEAASMVATPEDRLNALSEAFDKEQIPNRAAQAERDLRANQRTRSQEGTKKLAEDLNRLAGEMESIREAYRQGQKDELIAELKGIFNDLLNVSRSQESAANQAEQGKKTLQEGLANQQTRDLNATSRIAERMGDALKKTFLIPPQATSGLQNAMTQMQKSVGDLQRGLNDRAGDDAREAMAGLNTAAMAAWEAITAVKGAGSATGLDEMLQQLAEASDRQGDLNGETEGAMGQPGPGETPGGSGLGSLSAEQQAIQQMLDELRQKFGPQEGDALGDLGKVSEDMEEVARQLGRNQLDNRTVDRQRKILSRMLDAQRALRQRGFSNDREARTGASFAYRGPGSLPADLGESDNPLRDRLREALGQGYLEEDQNLIRRYFDRLMEDAAPGKATP